MSAEGGTFACDACGKRYAWKPQLAGKKAKCKCGATIVVPQEIAPQRDAPDDLYDVVDTPPPATTVTRPMPTTVSSAAAPAGAGLSYRSAPAKEDGSRDRFSEAMTDPLRDLYIPVALSIIGLVGIIAWAVHMGAGPGMITTVAVVANVATLIKTAILIGAAFLFAPGLGISFGDLRTAILKFGAIIVFTDAFGLWFDEIIEMMGGYPRGRAGGRIFWLQMFMIGAIIACLCYYLFDMDGEDAKTFALPFAIASQVIGFVLWLILGVVLENMAPAPTAAAAAPAPAPGSPGRTPGAPSANVAPAPPPPPMAAPGVPLQANARDREIERMIGTGGRMMQEANEYNQSQPQRSKRDPELVNQFYGAGAKRVYFDLGGKHIVVQLPDDPAGRTRCFAVAEAYRAAKAPQSPAPVEQGQRYLELELAPLPARNR